ncbi:MAG: IPTL-CTERM sorting domain-containing protein [Pseudomonadota bacterium]
MSTKTYIKILALTVILLFSSMSKADVIRYTFVDVAFEDGATLTGFFDWDTSLPDISSEYAGSSVNYEFAVAGGDELTIPPFAYSDEVAGEIALGGTTDSVQIFQFGNSSMPPERLVTIIPDPDFGILGEDLDIPLRISTGNSIEIYAVGDAFELREMVSGNLQGEIISRGQTASVPTLSTWSLVFLALLAMVVAATQFRRQ